METIYKMIYDVAIIGSGPSGASAALHSAQKGLKTIIIEKEVLPRYKTCGGGFVFRGRKSMPFDISSVVEREFKAVDIKFGSQNKTFRTERKSPIVSMVMRDAFDHLIVKVAQENGVELLQGEALCEIELGEVATLTTTQKKVRSRFVIAADGALSKTAKLAGWEETRMMCPALEYEVEVEDAVFDRLSTSARFDIDAVPRGYAWCFPKENHLSIGVGHFMKIKKTPDLKKCYQTYLKKLGISAVKNSSVHGFIIPTSPRQDGFVKKNVFLIGDAAGFADPLTAEGISNAIYSGNLAAEAISKSNMDLELAADNYYNLLRQKLMPELNSGVELARLFYTQKNIRNLMLNRFGQQLAEAMTSVFMGERSYPFDVKRTIKNKLGKAFSIQAK